METADRGHAIVVICDAGRVARPNAGTVDVIARLRLEAKRAGLGFVLRHANQELVDLLDLAGLTEIVESTQS
ncbi:MAG: hypothetical protein QOG16_247 [Actinomycetota bacterium]|jgi:hypothetical protein|nr:hypothetical protein [Actinomycetota bacterium]